MGGTMVRTTLKLITCAVLIAGCADDSGTSQPVDTAGHDRAEMLRARARAMGLASTTELHELSAAEADREIVALGRDLFFDPILSGELDVACSTCHHPTLGFADGRALPIGVAGVGLGPDRYYPEGANIRPVGELRPLGRHSPTVLNLAALVHDAEQQERDMSFTWDGRITALADFAHIPLQTRDEMRGDAVPAAEIVDEVVARLAAIEGYEVRFRSVFPELFTTPLEIGHVEQALNAFLLSLTSPPTAWDRFLDGEAPPSEAFLDGLELFLDLGCATCHTGSALSDGGFHRTGVAPNELSRPFQGGVDIGREESTGRQADRFRFRTATLREVARTAPYMHSGMLASLEDVVLNYTSGDNPLADLEPYDGAELERGTPRILSDDEVAALIVLLESMSSPPGVIEATFPGPDVVPSGLPASALELSAPGGRAP